MRNCRGVNDRRGFEVLRCLQQRSQVPEITLHVSVFSIGDRAGKASVETEYCVTSCQQLANHFLAEKTIGAGY
ncbi:hypothetical protein D3C85_1576400 [compost metagenome]